MNRFASPLSLIFAAILGGLVSQGISRWMPEAQAQEGKAKIQDEIRARRIVIVDEEGNERIVLETRTVGKKTDDVRVDEAALVIRGPKEKTTNELRLESSNSMSGMRLLKGTDQMVGLFGSEGGGAVLRLGGDGMLRESPFLLHVKRNGATSLVLSDESRARAVLGVIDLEAIKTGEVLKTAPSALTLFDKEGKVLWKAP